MHNKKSRYAEKNNTLYATVPIWAYRQYINPYNQLTGTDIIICDINRWLFIKRRTL